MTAFVVAFHVQRDGDDEREGLDPPVTRRLGSYGRSAISRQRPATSHSFATVIPRAPPTQRRRYYPAVGAEISIEAPGSSRRRRDRGSRGPICRPTLAPRLATITGTRTSTALFSNAPSRAFGHGISHVLGGATRAPRNVTSGYGGSVFLLETDVRTGKGACAISKNVDHWSARERWRVKDLSELCGSASWSA